MEAQERQPRLAAIYNRWTRQENVLKRFLAIIGTVALLCAGAALAQPGPGFGKKGGPPPPQPMPAKQVERSIPPVERMSPEDRRQLRRDIEKHGREIYPEPRGKDPH
jgi:hypothetical protein